MAIQGMLQGLVTGFTGIFAAQYHNIQASQLCQIMPKTVTHQAFNAISSYSSLDISLTDGKPKARIFSTIWHC